MEELKLFTKDNCGKCEHVKERMPKGLKIQVINADTVDGLAEAAYYEIVEKTFPVLVIDGEVVCGALPILERLNAVTGQK
ncbi:MAG: glutaredoxin family protein [Methanomassiliicoccaceae archaeon]|nr:glutaredoxin family protein [Methanomassiliicoccaceae archaeon]